MDTAAEFARRSEAHDAHGIAILLAEESDGAHLLSLVHRHVAVLIAGQVLAYHAVDQPFHLAQLLVADLLEVGEVEAQRVGADEGALLLDVVAEHLLQGVVQQVGSSMVGSRGIALVDVHTGHELSHRVFGQLLHDVHRLAVLALGVDDVDGFLAIDEDTRVAHLSAHLAIERGVVEHQLVEGVLLLGDLSIP